MKFPSFDTLLDKAGLVRKTDMDQAVNAYQEALRTCKVQSDKNAELAADLVLQCQEYSTQVDELADQNNKLREELSKSGSEVDSLRCSLRELYRRTRELCWAWDDPNVLHEK